MRHIQKQISLEPMTSRLPSVWPSYLNDELYYFDEASLIEREWAHPSNYGMIPMNIVINKTPSKDKRSSEYSLIHGCHCYGTSNEDYDKLCSFVLSFENLSKWYHFFTEYYNLLKRYGHCSRVYTSAEDYYNYESMTKYSNQMVYGGDKETYINLDEKFGNMGGVVEVTIFDKVSSEYRDVTPQVAHDEASGDTTAIVDVHDVGFFKWICDNVVPSFIIPNEYSDYWKRDVLYYPDVVNWLAWFKARNTKYDKNGIYVEGENGEVDHWNCKNEGVEDCCDCEEYFNRGGKKMFNLLKDWFENAQAKISTNNEVISNGESCFIPTVIQPTLLTLTIDDLGEKSIFSKEYELGIDYRTLKSDVINDSVQINYGDGNTNSGTTANVNGESLILKEGIGFDFDENFMEKFFNKCGNCEYEGVFGSVCPKCGHKNNGDEYGTNNSTWGSYTKHYIDTHKDDFVVSSITYYAFDENNVKYTTSESNPNTAMRDLSQQMEKIYHITKSNNGWVLIDGALHEVVEKEYGIYDTSNQYLGGRTFIVEREDFTNTPYTYVNGKKIYAEFYAPRCLFYFPFFKTKESQTTCSGTTFNINNYKTYERNAATETELSVDYMDKSWIIKNEDTTVEFNDEMVCPRISAYTQDEGGNYLYYTYESKIIDDNLNDVANARLYGDYIAVNNNTKFQMYSVDELTGRTVSKLYDLKLLNTLCDDIGNEIDGIYDVLKKDNHQPREGEELELLYQVGNVANVNRFSNTTVEIEDTDINENFFVGDIITNMTFYYNEKNDGKIDELLVDVTLVTSRDTPIVTATYIDPTTKERIVKTFENPSEYSSLFAIKKARECMKKYEQENIVATFDEDVYCDITYYVGATLRRKKNQRFNLSKETSRKNYGVEYKETVRFVKENREYYLKAQKKKRDVLPIMQNNVDKHSVSYPVVVYNLTQDLEQVTQSQYDEQYSVPMASFKININIYQTNSQGTYEKKFKNDMAKRNNMEVYPTFREEYLIGSSSLENIDADIYIDRGINASYERHLKLGEVCSLESLTQMGNGYFTIMTS